MTSSDDETENLPKSVTNYYFVDDAEEPISFSVLPVSWDSSETTQGPGKQIYVRGNADGGLDKLFKSVRAWKFDISGVRPEISVLSKDNNWIKLQKPRQSFEEYIRTVLITVNFLHVAKKHPDFSGKHIWKRLSEIFGLYDVIPSPKDLASHRALIEQSVKQDESLQKSKYLTIVLEKNPQKKHKADEDALVKEKSGFVVNDNDCSLDDLEDDSGEEEDISDNEDGTADEEDDEDEPFDSVCSICDEGGSLLCCDGSCMRSFHATKRAGKPSQCTSLGFTEQEVQDMPYFKCKNCQYKLHQCYVCGQLDSSDKQAGAKVFQCVNATCGYFYHPDCVARRLHVNEDDASKELAEKIRAGESFTCPLHICFICKQAEDKADPERQMAVCRRCPKAYHRKCLPKKIAFEDDEDTVQRAWEGLLADRILIYCLKHKIIEELGTPSRDHIKFPGDLKEKEYSAGVLKEGKVVPKKKLFSSKAPLVLESKKKTVEDSSPDIKSDQKVSKPLKKLPSEKKFGLTGTNGFSGVEERLGLQQVDAVKASKTENLVQVESTKTSKAVAQKFVPELDSDSERRILDLINEASSIITMDDIIVKHEKLISSRAYKQKMDPCKSITLGKVQAHSVALRDAIRKLDAGSSVEDARVVCGPSDLNQMVKWKSKLRVYLAPFIYGMRYTSFGRHFTKVDKLKEIVDTMHWYVNDDDTIVDFCCGANDFSLLMKEKLESRGKKCNYKNYDLFHPKNDFCFETRDWMDVQPSELPTGSKLIMGLNPPFGVKACKANQFINKALQFKPKLLILIVPPETERLDKKKQNPYDLVWEDKEKLSGKSFYLPGSVDINDKQMEDWNIVAPVLYLWSRPDWTAKHKEIARKHDHLLGAQRQNNSKDKLGHNLSFKNRDQSSITTKIDNASPKTHAPEGGKKRAVDAPERGKKRAVDATEDLEKQSVRKEHNIDKQMNATPVISRNKRKKLKKKRQNEGTHTGGMGESSQDYKRRRSSDRPQHEVSHHSPHNLRGVREPQNIRHHSGSPQFEPTSYAERRFSVENRISRYQGSPPIMEMGNPIRDQEHLVATSYRTANYGSPYYGDMPANHYPQGEIYPSGRERYAEDIGPASDYRPLRNTDSILGPMRSDIHGYGLSQSYGVSVEQPYGTPSGYSNRGNLNNMSAMDKYTLRLDEPAPVRQVAAAYGPPLGPPSGVGFYQHHQAHPERAGYPGGQMGFAPGPANPYHHHGSSGGWIDG